VYHVTYTVYIDAAHETRVYPGWDDSVSPPTTTGPIVVTKDDRENGFTETLSMSVTAHLSPAGLPDGGESIADAQSNGQVQSLSRTYVFPRR